MVLQKPPPYKVIDAEPSMGKIITNFNVQDAQMFGLTVAGSVTYGWMTMKRFGKGHVYMAGILGTTAGVMYAMQSSFYRLTGWKPSE